MGAPEPAVCNQQERLKLKPGLLSTRESFSRSFGEIKKINKIIPPHPWELGAPPRHVTHLIAGEGHPTHAPLHPHLTPPLFFALVYTGPSCFRGSSFTKTLPRLPRLSRPDGQGGDERRQRPLSLGCR